MKKIKVVSTKKKRDYRSRGRKWFIEYIPDSIWTAFDEDVKKHYRLYRRYHYLIDDRLRKIEALDEELQMVKIEMERIKSEKKKLEEKINSEGGFKDKMLLNYSFVKEFDINVQFDSWIELRDKSLSDEKNIKWYSFVRTVVDGKRQKKSIYCGSEKRLRDELGRLLNKDLSSRGKGFIRLELLNLTRQYAKFTTYNSDWRKFMMDSHNITKMVDWGIEIGKTERNKWGK